MGGSIEPGWYADPQGDAQTLRWWNGEGWTRHTRSLSELQGGADGSDEEAATTYLGGQDGGTSPGDDDEEGTVRLGSSTPSPAPIEDEPSTMRIDPSWARQASPTPGPPSGSDDDQGTVRIDPSWQESAATPAPPTPVGDEPSTMRIDPSWSRDEDDEATADLGSAARDIREGTPVDAPGDDTGATIRVDPSVLPRAGEDGLPTADLTGDETPTADLGDGGAGETPRTAVFNPDEIGQGGTGDAPRTAVFNPDEVGEAPRTA
ncbi:MAG TPA: DUF2510 domain-containing protein, partial [Nocardiopsis listeri]|uniref:DUF2510 domain-containing protein n=1 Tax=Nocardiopsis listeri TaxID=53440 RepID=UPI001D6CC499